MAVAYRSGGSVQVGGTSVTITGATGCSVGDVLVLVVFHKGTGTPATPSGWTVLPGGTHVFASNSGRLAVFWRVVTASGDQSNVTVSSLTSSCSGSMAAFSGVNKQTPFRANSTPAYFKSTTYSSEDLTPGVIYNATMAHWTDSGNGDMLLYVQSNDNDDSCASQVVHNGSGSSIGSMTEIGDNYTTTGTDNSTSWAYLAHPSSADAYGTASALTELSTGTSTSISLLLELDGSPTAWTVAVTDGVGIKDAAAGARIARVLFCGDAQLTSGQGNSEAIAAADMADDEGCDYLFCTGDHTENGRDTASEYETYYTPAWGRAALKSKHRTTPGNHDWNSGNANAANMTTYFNDLAITGSDPDHYFSFDVGGWHVIVLNSNLSMASGSAQYTWLSSDLSNNATKPTILLWHNPYLVMHDENGSGTTYGYPGEEGGINAYDVWALAYGQTNKQVEFILGGHSHVVGRSKRVHPLGRQTAGSPPNVSVDATNGIRQFIGSIAGEGGYVATDPDGVWDLVGNGAGGIYAVNDLNTGYWRLDLYADRYEWTLRLEPTYTTSSLSDSGQQSIRNTITETPCFVVDFQQQQGQSWTPTVGPDAVGITDTVQVQRENIGPTDAVGITDSISLVLDRARDLTDPVGVTDSLARDVGLGVTDAVGITDPAPAVDKGKTVDLPADAVGVTDALTFDRGREPIDPVGVTDAVARVWDATRDLADSVGVTDSVTLDHDVALTDSVGVTDPAPTVDVTGGQEWTPVVGPDPVGLTDTLALEHERNLVDPVGLTDSVQVQREQIGVDDQVGITDDVVVEKSGAQVVERTDPVGITDQVVLTRENIGVDDPVGITDEVGLVVDRVRETSDQVGITDGIDVQHTVPGEWTVTPTDPVGITDSVQVQRPAIGPTDQVGITDSVALDLTRAITDSVGITDSRLVERTKNVDLSNPVGITDSRTIERGIGPTDTVGITDSLIIDRSLTILDTVTTVDDLLAAAGYVRDLVDAVGITEWMFAGRPGEPARTVGQPRAAGGTVTVRDSGSVVDER